MNSVIRNAISFVCRGKSGVCRRGAAAFFLLTVFFILCKVPSLQAETQKVSWKSIPGQITVEGTVVKRSLLPDPLQSDYPDCCYTVHFKGNSVLSGGTCKRELNLVVEGFRNYKEVDSAAIHVNDLVRCTIVPFENLPDEIKSIQQADDLNLFQLDSYYVISVQKIAAFSRQMSLFSGETERVRFVAPPPISKEIECEIQQYIKRETESVSDILNKISKLKSEPLKLNVFAQERLKQYNEKKDDSDLLFWHGDHVIRIFPNQVFPDRRPPKQDAIDIITKFNQQLKRRNIRLIFVSFPYLWEGCLTYSCENIPDGACYSETRLRFVQELLKNGVEVIELGHRYQQCWNDFPYFHDIIVPDPHPADGAIELLTDELVNRLSSYDIKEYQYPQSCYSKIVQQQVKPGNFPVGNAKYVGHRKLQRYVFKNPQKISKPESRFFVIGDSFSITPWGTAGIREYLGAKLRINIGGFQNQSGAARLAKIISARGYLPLSQKEVVIMLIAPNYIDNGVWEDIIDSDKSEKILLEITEKNLPETWKKFCKVDSDGFILIPVNTQKNGGDLKISPVLELRRDGGSFLPEKKYTVHVETYARRVRVNLCSQDGRVVKKSVNTDSTDEKDDIALSFFTSGEEDKLGFRMEEFNSAKREFIKIKSVKIVEDGEFHFSGSLPDIVRSVAENMPPNKTKVLDVYDFSAYDLSLPDENDKSSFMSKGPSMDACMTKQFYAVADKQKIKMEQTVKNSGNNSVFIYYGCVPYTKDKLFLNFTNYPYLNAPCSTIVNVLPNEKKIVLEGNVKQIKLCRVAKNVREDLSDVPNFHLLPGYIVSVAPAADGNTELILDKNDMSGIQKGDKVRVHGPGGAYFYSGPAFVLHPGETRQIEWELASGNEKIWSNGKLPAGTGYVKPLIFILDTQKGTGHCVQIHNCKMTYCE